MSAPGIYGGLETRISNWPETASSQEPHANEARAPTPVPGRVRTCYANGGRVDIQSDSPGIVQMIQDADENTSRSGSQVQDSRRPALGDHLPAQRDHRLDQGFRYRGGGRGWRASPRSRDPKTRAGPECARPVRQKAFGPQNCATLFPGPWRTSCSGRAANCSWVNSQAATDEKPCVKFGCIDAFLMESNHGLAE